MNVLVFVMEFRLWQSVCIKQKVITTQSPIKLCIYFTLSSLCLYDPDFTPRGTLSFSSLKNDQMLCLSCNCLLLSVSRTWICPYGRNMDRKNIINRIYIRKPNTHYFKITYIMPIIFFKHEVNINRWLQCYYVKIILIKHFWKYVK